MANRRVANRRRAGRTCAFFPIRYSPIRHSLVDAAAFGKAVRLELVAQRGLQDLAGRGVRNAVDEGDVVGHPPFGDLAVHEFQDVLAACLLALLELHDQQRPLVPFRMMDADHGGFRHRGMADREVFQIDRRNPFAAGLDHVLGAIGDPHVAVRIDGGDVAGVEIAFARRGYRYRPGNRLSIPRGPRP